MTKRRATWVILAVGVGLLLAACGGSGTGPTAPLPPGPTYTIAGTISGDVVEGVTVMLTGAATRQDTTDATGAYRFEGVPEGAYRVTPSVAGDYVFTPAQRDLTVQEGDVAAADFDAAVWTPPPAFDTTPPTDPVRLIFVHHSVGSNWLATGNGNLGNTLGTNNYCVRDVSYGWDAPENTDIGSLTDIGNWYTWFADTTVQGNGKARRDNILDALYVEDHHSSSYTPIADPGGENDIVLFKSCFPNSNVRDDNAHPPADLYGQAAGSAAHTLGNCKDVYRQILAACKTRPDKMFVVATAPPLVAGSTDATRAANARALNKWLVETWLVEGAWEDRNVYVFDFYDVLTDADNHHRAGTGAIEYVTSHGDDTSAYGQGGDSHPNAAGGQKATDEFVPLLNVYYHRWQHDLGNE